MYKKIVIVGVGLIGGSLGLAVRRKHPDTVVCGVSSRGAVNAALEMDAITEGCGYEEIGDAVTDADLVVLCTPIHRIKGLMTVIAPSVPPGAVVTDVGSTKRAVTSHAAEVLPGGVYFIGGHPMTGSEKSGVWASDPFLFQNAIYVLCPVNGVPDAAMNTFSDFVHSLGARVVVMNADQHDRIAAAVSHLPQMIAITLVNMVGQLSSDQLPYLHLAAGGFKDMTRIASSPFSMWDDICRTNDDAIREMIDVFIRNLEDVRDRVGSAGLGYDFEVANVTRATIPKDTKGFVSTLSEVLVVVEDKPGIIAGIATKLADADINIKDIEVLKVREGEGGTIRLAFDQVEEANEAVSLLKTIGFSARVRG